MSEVSEAQGDQVSKTDKTMPLRLRGLDKTSHAENGVSRQSAKALKRQRAKAQRRSSDPLTTMHGRHWYASHNLRMLGW